MNNKPKTTQPQEIQAYRVTINTASFQTAKSALKERTQEQYLPHYWEKFDMDRKKIVASREDRLSRLTTKQIDRIIDMEKIRSLLYDKKRRVKQQYFQYDTFDPTAHSNVYQANFLAKINQIAIRRNIKPESEVVDEFIADKKNKLKEKDKTLARPLRFNKDSLADTHRTWRKASNQDNELKDEKSIGSIEDDLEQFEEKLQQKKKIKKEYRKSVKTQYKLIPSNRWFYGMSTHFLDKNRARESVSRSECYRGAYDIESELRQTESRDRNKNSLRLTQYSNRTSDKSKLQPKITEPFGQFRTSRLVTID